jgi:hypothetical protein
MRRKKQAIETDEIELAQVFGFVRIITGAALFFAPRRSARTWTGESSRELTSNLAVRGMGARDIAIGLGILMALERGAPVRGWLEAGVLSDAADAVGTLSQWGDLGTPRALFWLAAELGAAWMGSQLAQSVD